MCRNGTLTSRRFRRGEGENRHNLGWVRPWGAAGQYDSRTRRRRILNRRQHDEPCCLLSAAGAFEALAQGCEGGVAVHLHDLDRGQRPGGVAEGALDPEAAAEADEIAGRADMLVGH
jgi:hypothetical protein